MSETKNTTNSGANMSNTYPTTIEEFRATYRGYMNDAKAHGWTPQDFNARCKVLADWRLSRYADMSKPEAYMLSAQECFVEEILSNINA
jgi:hypothetical protein